MSDNEVQAFDFETNKIRTIMISDEPWFAAKDVAESLGYVWNGTSRIAHVPSEWRGVTSVVTPSGIQEMAILSEQGLYFFLSRSDKPKALPFQKWVASSVLPSLRKNGGYIMGQEKMTSEQLLAHALIVANNVIENEKKLRVKAEGEVKMLVHDFNKEYTTTEIAKELHLRSARELNDKLSEMKIQFKQNGTWVLYSDYSGEHYTSIKNTVLDSGKVVYDRLWTGLGRKFILNLFGVEAKDNVN